MLANLRKFSTLLYWVRFVKGTPELGQFDLEYQVNLESNKSNWYCF